MKNCLLKLGCAALAPLLALPTANGQQNTGPIRQGVRGVAEGTAQAVRRTGEATRNVVRGAAEGTANAVRRTGEAARNLGENTRDRLQGDYRGNNQIYNDNQNLNNQIDGQYQGQYQSGFRGVDPNAADHMVEGQGQYDAQNQPSEQSNQRQWNSNRGNNYSGQVYQLRHDASGREFICMNGQRVYFDEQNSANAQPMQRRSMYGSEESHNRNDINADALNATDQNAAGQDNFESVPLVPQLDSANPNQPLSSEDQAIQDDARENTINSLDSKEANELQDEQQSQLDETQDEVESKVDSAEKSIDNQQDSDQ